MNTILVSAIGGLVLLVVEVFVQMVRESRRSVAHPAETLRAGRLEAQPQFAAFDNVVPLRAPRPLEPVMPTSCSAFTTSAPQRLGKVVRLGYIR